MAHSVTVGIIGCGNISTTYLKTLRRFPQVQVRACADIDPARARAYAEKNEVSQALSVEELLADPDIQLVVNLTIPNAHYEVSLAALQAGKHVHTEKPLCLTREQSHRLLETAREQGVRLGAAPDTFLGGGFQTCRQLIDEGQIGEPVGATAFLLNHGHESWHPDPEFYYKAGGGPMYDMGPYYLTTLVSLIGPLRRVTGFQRTTFAERTITSEPRRGALIRVEVPTFFAGAMEFENGALGSLITTFDVWASHLPHLEIFGTEGSLALPDPNWFRGPVSIRRRDQSDWTEVPLTHGLTEDSLRGLGAVDMAHAILSGRPHRASAEMGAHVVEAMVGFHQAAEQGCRYEMTSRCERPAPMPAGLPADRLDD